jgi:DNA-binding FadR family transcriptional regulator
MQQPHRNLTQQLVQELGKSILQGKYSVGGSFPSEAELSAEFDISRTATREAVKMLTAKGLISSRPRKGITVLDIKQWNLFDADILQWILLGKPDLYMLRHFQQLRLAIEPEAAFLAAEHATSDDIILIENALKRMKQAHEGYDDTHEADIDFHKSVLVASNNPFFSQLTHFIEIALKINIRFTQRLRAVTEDEYQTHADILNHIKNKDAQAAFDCAMKTQKETIRLINEKIALLKD